MKYLLFFTALTLAVVLLIVVRDFCKLKRDYRRLSRQVHGEQEKLAFLINKNFEVKETNYFAINTHMKDNQPRILGNVMHCKNGTDAGYCGMGAACQNCPVRYVIKNSFQQRRDFTNIEATMTLYDEHHKAVETDIMADGQLAYVNHTPYMIIKITSIKEEPEIVENAVDNPVENFDENRE